MLLNHPLRASTINAEPRFRRVNGDSARARANGTKLGRRRVEPAVEARILELKADGHGILKIGRKLGIGTSVVQRIFMKSQVP
jgi:DNA invertase Pin-like site-specific DNA recombinase